MLDPIARFVTRILFRAWLLSEKQHARNGGSQPQNLYLAHRPSKASPADYREKEKFFSITFRYLSRNKVGMLILAAFAIVAFMIGFFTVNKGTLFSSHGEAGTPWVLNLSNTIKLQPSHSRLPERRVYGMLTASLFQHTSYLPKYSENAKNEFRNQLKGILCRADDACPETSGSPFHADSGFSLSDSKICLFVC